MKRYINFQKIFSVVWRTLCFGLLSLALLLPANTHAITQRNLSAVINNTVHYDACGVRQGNSTTGSNAGETGQTAYMLGDSKGFQLQQNGGIGSKFSNVGWELTNNSVPGRSYTSGGGPTPGGPRPQTVNDALTADQAKIQTARAIIIELGTNPPATVNSNFRTQVENTIRELKELNPDAAYYYVDIGATANPQEYSRRNRVIYDNADSFGYTVISEYKNNFGANSDPQNIPGPDSINLRTETSPPADTNDYLQPDFIHNTNAGATSLAELITTTVTGSPSNNPGSNSNISDVSGDCVCQENIGGSVGNANFSGSTNGEIAYNFFVSMGLSPAQAAGIVGNLMVESGGHTLNLDPRATNGSHWGIAQWDSGRWADLTSFAASPLMSQLGLSNDPHDLRVQLYFIWYEMTGEPPAGTPGGGSESRTIGPLRAATSPTDAADVFNRLYERSGTAVGRRADHAEAVMLLFGGGGGGGGGNTGNTGGSTGCPGTASGQFRWPVEGTASISACWGDVRRGGRRHSGLDIAVSNGTSVLAADGGVVEVAQDQGGSGYGKVIVINHNNGFWTLYGHNSELLVSEGDTVTKGQIIAKSGNTGYSFGPHLHFNVQKVGGIQGSGLNTVNPLTNGLSIPQGVEDTPGCQNHPDGGRQGGNI